MPAQRAIDIPSEYHVGCAGELQWERGMAALGEALSGFWPLEAEERESMQYIGFAYLRVSLRTRRPSFARIVIEYDNTPTGYRIHVDAADGEGWLLLDVLIAALRSLSIRHEITVWDEAPRLAKPAGSPSHEDSHSGSALLSGRSKYT